MFDLVITGGTVIDGTGTPGVRADVGVADGRIAAVGDLAGAEAVETVDATDKVVCPGYWTCSAKANPPANTRIPAIRLAIGVFAPLLTFKVDRVNEPEAGMPEKQAQPKFAMPSEKASWLTSTRPP